ncbi:hypothetical protein SFRURICE_005406 [Spodoptera frugiperda]|nr:hypothetical protein SFRURICE_005406 [Spodoptera frugiperda]
MVSNSGFGKPGFGCDRKGSKESKILLGRSSGHVSKSRQFTKHKTMGTIPVPSVKKGPVVHSEWHFKSEDTDRIIEWSSTSSEDMVLSQEVSRPH